MSWSLSDPGVRVQLFRFIDALPALKSASSVRRHLQEYLAEAGENVPWWLRLSVSMAEPGTEREELLAWAARLAAQVMARKFIAGATPGEATTTVLRLRARKLAFTADLLGEAVISEAEADVYQQTCLDLLRGLAGPLQAAPEVPLIDRDQDGPIPRVNLSLKLSSLTTDFDPIHAETAIAGAAERLRPILRTARELGAYVHVDMEQYTYRALSYALFCRVLAEPEFRDWPDVGIVVQAYQPDAEAELMMLREWVESRGAPITIRLVKGAYWDYEVLTARRLGWPEPVYPAKVAKRRHVRALHPVHDRASRPASAGLRQPQHPQPGARDRGRRGHGITPGRLRAPDTVRHGRRDSGRPGGARPPRPCLHALRGHAARHGLPGAPAAGKHFERVVPQGQLHRERARGRPAARPRGDRIHAQPHPAVETSDRPRHARAAAVSQ